MYRTSIEDELNKNGVLVYTNDGDSMFPLIRKKGDLIVIQKCNRPLKKYDIPLYKRSSGQYVLHRIVGFDKDNAYVICGDNRYNKEYGITDDNVLGILTSVIRNGKEIKMDSFLCRLYSHLWCDAFVLRKLVLYIRDAIKK